MLGALDPGAGHPIDVHGGGTDLIFPHHESEIAQAAGAGISPYARLWVHVAMVGYQGEKMSKSIGNLVFVRQLLERVPAATVRLLLAGHHHRAAWEYTDQDLAAADARRLRYAGAARAGATLDRGEAEGWRASFLERIDDDLDAPGALVVTDRLSLPAHRRRVIRRSGGGVGPALPAPGPARGGVLGRLRQVLLRVPAAAARGRLDQRWRMSWSTARLARTAATMCFWRKA